MIPLDVELVIHVLPISRQRKTEEQKKKIAEWAKMPITHARVKHRITKMYVFYSCWFVTVLPILTQEITDTVHSLDCLALLVSISCCRQRRAQRTVGSADGVEHTSEWWCVALIFPFPFPNVYQLLNRCRTHSSTEIQFILRRQFQSYEQIYIYISVFVVVVLSYGVRFQFLRRRRR